MHLILTGIWNNAWEIHQITSTHVPAKLGI